MKEEKVFRLYNKKGEHILSLLECTYDSTYYDLASPEGEIFMCDEKVGDILYTYITKNATEETL